MNVLGKKGPSNPLGRVNSKSKDRDQKEWIPSPPLNATERIQLLLKSAKFCTSKGTKRDGCIVNQTTADGKTNLS